MTTNPSSTFQVPGAPVSEAGASAGQQRPGRRLGLLGQPEEGVVLHARLPEALAHVSAGHGKLQRVLAGRLRAQTHRRQ